jgi:hypothetical protein
VPLRGVTGVRAILASPEALGLEIWRRPKTILTGCLADLAASICQEPELEVTLTLGSIHDHSNALLRSVPRWTVSRKSEGYWCA